MSSKERPRRLAPTPWDGQRGFFAALNRIVYRFEGPAQLGTAEPEEPYRPRPDAPCPICSVSMTQHVIQRGGPGERTFVHCPR